MADLEDFEIDGEVAKPGEGEGDEPGPSPERRSPPPFPFGMIAIGVALVGAIGLVMFLFLRPGNRAPTATATTPALASPAATFSAEPAIALPPLAESDAFVRDLAKGLSSHPQLGAWLAARGLVRTLTVAVQNVAEGRSPAPFLPFLTPTTRFKAEDKGGRLLPDPKSYAAYDDFADAVATLDVAECARVYRILAPLFGAAYADLGYPAADFPKAINRALDVLRTTPMPGGDIVLHRGPVFLEYADSRLETLDLAQKQLLRMGLRNARIVQKKAAELAPVLSLAAQAGASPAPAVSPHS
jgi:hypothetical protein